MRFPIILVDPPWPFRVWNKDTGNGRSAESHYRTMTWEELYSLGPFVNNVAEDNAALMLWVCRPSQHQAIQMINEWNERLVIKRYHWYYKTELFTWVKRTKSNKPATGMGYYTRSNTEAVWLFTRGKSLKRKSKSVSQVIETIGSLPHSQKPEEAQNRIERLFDGPYLELFGRRPRDNWKVLGNEIDGKDIRQALQEVSNSNGPI